VDDLGVDINLSEFFTTIGMEKKRKKEELDSLISNSFEDFFLQPLKEEIAPKKVKRKEKVEPQITEVNVEIVANPPTLIEKSLGLLSEPDNINQQNDPITPLDQNFVTLEQLNQHYNKFLSRIQQQLSTLGGGGETRLEFLDDVDRNSTKTDNYYLKYDASLNKWIGDNPVGVTSITSITGVTTYYQATNTDDYIGVSADVPVTIVLPLSPLTGKKIIVKDEGNKISTYNITVQAGIGKSVENDISVTMSSNHQSFTFFYNDYNWYII
jgi:hypothetical protein